jgi:amino acid transporter
MKTHSLQFWLPSIFIVLFVILGNFSGPTTTFASQPPNFNPIKTEKMAENPVRKHIKPFVKKEKGFYLIVGMGFIIFALSAIVLLTLKLLGVLAMVSWVWVLSPLWILGALMIFAFIFAFFVGKKIQSNA